MGNDLIKWLWDNLSAIKDILWIIFTLIATIIAVLTYRRARYTILQPLRSEVIKRQTDLLIEVLEAFSDDNRMMKNLDLFQIVTLNTYKVLIQCGHTLSGSEILQKECDKNLVGGLIVKQGSQLEMFEKPEPFQESGKEEDKTDAEIGRRFCEYLKEGKIDIEIIYLTGKYYESMKKYQDLLDDTFLSKEIRVFLEEIIRNIYDDITVTLKQILEDVALHACERKKNNEKFSINTIGIYNEFNDKRHDNSRLIAKVRERIRDYLMIDRKW